MPLGADWLTLANSIFSFRENHIPFYGFPLANTMKSHYLCTIKSKITTCDKTEKTKKSNNPLNGKNYETYIFSNSCSPDDDIIS